MTSTPFRQRQFVAPFVLVLVILITSCSSTATPSGSVDTSVPANTVSATVTRRAPTLSPATLAPTAPTSASAVTPLQVGQGYGAEKGFWQVFFTAPTGSRDASTYVG